MTMIEKVAKALADFYGEEVNADHIAMARDAIGMMMEVTPAMVAAGSKAASANDVGGVFAAMVIAALEETGE